MTEHFQKEIAKLKKKLLYMTTLVEESLHKAILSIQTNDKEIAQKVIDGDEKIDELEVELEEDCLKILALYQPVAKDLRFVVVVLKINNDLERIGDIAANIAERAIYLTEHGKTQIPEKLDTMAEKTKKMIEMSLKALIDKDIALAKEVIKRDDEIDNLNREMYELVYNEIRENIANLKTRVHILSASRYLERIADHTTNIAEDIIYMLNGEIVRHKNNLY